VSTVSVVSVVLRAIPLAVVVGLTVLLARSAVSHWARERAGRAYELPADYRPALVRGSAAAIVLVLGGTAIALAFPLPGLGGDPGTSVTAKAAAAPPAAQRGRAHHHRRRGRLRTGAPEPAATASANAADRAAPRVLAAPAGGSLRVLADGTRVWLPPQYAYPKAADLAFPVVVAYLPDTPAYLEELYPAFVRHVELGKADPFVVVEPASCSADPVAAVAEAARHYRLLTGPAARGVLGVGALAPCGVRAALAHPDAFGAGAGVSGTYDDAVPLPATALPGPSHLLLTAAYGEPARRQSAYRLRAALRALGTEARIIDAVHADPLLGGTGRRHELAIAAQYFTEVLDGPGRVRTG
jgi:hypothetical protein